MIDIMGHTPDATTLRDLVVLRASYGDKPFLVCRDETLTYQPVEKGAIDRVSLDGET